MKSQLWTIGLLLSGSMAFAQEPSADVPPEQKGITVEARGPVHEAYAQPGYVVPQASIVVPKEPPAPVPEEPPDQKPSGNVQWVPGYWAWDADRSDFLWVSGFWRQPPPNRRWVPGTWNKVTDGFQWTPGYWASNAAEDAPYLEAPPETLDNGPNIPAPDDNSVYVPGIWVYRGTGFAWRPGYWLGCRNGWLWTPAHYCWTPRGNLYCDGFWDYPLENRGLLFAPVSFAGALWNDLGWRYRPWCGVNTPALLTSLFIGPRNHNYWFGDWYGDRYARLGFRSWVGDGARFYDPLLGYYRWAHRDNPAWFRDLRALDAGRRDGTFERPAHTLGEQNNLLRNNVRTNVNNQFVGNRNEFLQTVTPAREIGNLSRLSEEQRRTEINRTRETEALRQHRTEVQQANVGRLNLSGNRPATVDHGRVETRGPEHGNTPRVETRAPQHVESHMPQHAVTPHNNVAPHAAAPANVRPQQQRSYTPTQRPAPARVAPRPAPQPQRHAAPRPPAHAAPPAHHR
jgi:hypothetical protein